MQTDRDEKLAADQNTPPTNTACFPPHMISLPFHSFTLDFCLSLFLFPSTFSPVALNLPLLPRGSISLHLAPCSPCHLPFSIFRRPFLHPFLPFFLSSPLCSSPRFTLPQLPRGRSRNRERETEKRRARQGEVVVSRLRQSCHQLRDLRVCAAPIYTEQPNQQEGQAMEATTAPMGPPPPGL